MKAKRHPRQQPLPVALAQYWSIAPEQLLASLHADNGGLPTSEARKRLKQFGRNSIKAQEQASVLALLLGQFKSPLILILIVAAIISSSVGEWADAGIVLVVVFGSTLLGLFQEYRASNAVKKLRSKLTIKSRVLRKGQEQTIPSSQLVPGDVVLLSAGSLIPADGIVLATTHCFVNQAVLTGETFQVEKQPGIVNANASLPERSNCVFMGTSVSSGTATLLVVATGKNTLFGEIAQHLSQAPRETEFEAGIHRFGNLLTQVMLVMVIIVLVINLFLDKPLIESLLFALALAVGLTPELLPAIISITLAHGAKRMAKHGVIVRHLNSIENFGSMDVLCTDKTGTLTEGIMKLDGALDARGQPSASVLHYAYLNAYFQNGLTNTLDDAIQACARQAGQDIDNQQKLGEVPYDFVRKRLSVITADPLGNRTLITKGALKNVLGICTHIQNDTGLVPMDEASQASIEKLYSEWSAKGYRVLGIASKAVDRQSGIFSHNDENNLAFAGFLLFFDPPKADVTRVISDLAKRGVQLKIITGDNQHVARHIAEAVNLPVTGLLTGSDLANITDEALFHLAEHTTIFAEVDPNQKERIILALQKTGHVVGYMGDGINDAPALHAADVSVSVDTAVDVAKEAADFVLLQSDLGILREGIDEGRRTFVNTLKYILTTISANFGNMFSMAWASLFLPFLPLLASQILLNNLLSDIPGVTVASDNVDPEWVEKPRRWNTLFIRNYMVLFGLVSSLFDFLTFAILLYIFKATPEEFRTGWFIESLLTELVIALIVRTRHVFFRSRPGTLLLTSTLLFIGITLAIPYLPFSHMLGFIPLPAPLMLSLLGLTVLYVIATELAKKFFYSKMKTVMA